MSLVQNQKISFSTSVEWIDRPFVSAVERYLNFGDKVAVQLYNAESNYIKEGTLQESWIHTKIKIATMILSLGILPLIALVVKGVARYGRDFRWGDSKVLNIQFRFQGTRADKASML